MVWKLSLIATILVLGLVVDLTHGQEVVCPTEGFPAECDCYEEERAIACPTQVTDSIWDMRSTFDSVANAINNDSILWNKLYFEGQQLTTPQPIGEDTITRLKFKEIALKAGTITTIHPNAFPGTYGSTEILYIAAHDISTYSENLEFLNQFTNLQQLDFYGGLFSSLTANALQRLQSLRHLVLAISSVAQVGDRAFAGLSNLEWLDLHGNSLTNEGISQNAFEGLNPNAAVRLHSNAGLNYLEEEKFKALSDGTNGSLTVGPNYNEDYDHYMDCDERADWICANAELYRTKLFNFKCRGNEWNTYIWDCCVQK